MAKHSASRSSRGGRRAVGLWIAGLAISGSALAQSIGVPLGRHNTTPAMRWQSSGGEILTIVTASDSESGPEWCWVIGTTQFDRLELTGHGQVVHRGSAPQHRSWPNLGHAVAVEYAGICYVATPAAGDLVVLDRTTSEAPQISGIISEPGWTATTSLCVDRVTGRLTACTNLGVMIFDLATPTAPQRVAHDPSRRPVSATSRRGRALFADSNAGSIELVDVAALPTITAVGSMPLAHVHEIHISLDLDLGVAVAGPAATDLVAIDLTTPSAPRLASRMVVDQGSIRRLQLVDRVAHVATTAGYWIVDVSDPASLVATGWSTEVSDAQAVATDLPSGQVLVSQRHGSEIALFNATVTAAAYGAPTPGAGGRIPQFRLHGVGWLGSQSFGFDCEGAPPHSMMFFLTAHQPTNWNVNGLHVLVDTINSPGSINCFQTDALGRATVRHLLPTAPRYHGRFYYGQVICFDTGSPLGVTASRGKKFALHYR